VIRIEQEAVITIDRERAADFGLSAGAVGDAVSTYVLGKAATYYREGGDEFTVRVQLEEQDRQTSARFEALPLITPSGARITLGDVARIDKREAPVSIRRLNQERIVTVSAGFAGRDLGSIMDEIQRRVAEIEVPYGFEIATGGEAKEQQETFFQLLIGFALAIILVYMVMASLSESFVHPFIMRFAIPFAAIGVVGSLLLTDRRSRRCNRRWLCGQTDALEVSAFRSWVSDEGKLSHSYSRDGAKTPR